MDIEAVLRIAPVIPVVVIQRIEHAVPLARALVAGGLRVIEVTLRTPVALGAAEAISREVEGAIVGLGTITRPDEIDRARRAGAAFGVSPGLTPELIAAAQGSALPWLPGVMTPSEVIAARAAGFRALKLFPAAPAGGPGLLKALAGPFPDATFCPTGGVSAANASEYLALDNVVCVGGSWITPEDAVAAGDWHRITTLARAASALRRTGVDTPP